jgi:hypothetical protein
MVASKIDEYGKIGWLTVTILAFWLAWPLALLVVAYLIGSGRVQTWRSEVRMPGTWFNLGGKGVSWPGFRATGSGNRTFDEYRKQTLNELEAEQREFQSFLEQLRAARDKAEFDAFMAQRRQKSDGHDASDGSAS